MEKLFNFVYVTTNTVTGMQYVGDHSTDDLECPYSKNYLGSGRPYLKNALKEYGKKNFIILEFFPTKQEAFNAQEKYILKFNTLVPNGYNLSTSGGFLAGGSHSEESKEKIRIKHKGVKFSAEHKANLSKAGMGRVSPNKGKPAWNKGKTLSSEHKNRIHKSLREFYDN